MTIYQDSKRIVGTNADRVGTPAVLGGWKELDRTTLGSAGDTISVSSLTDKRYWIENHFGELFHKRIVTTHQKNMLMGDYLIDDRKKNGAGEFKGELLQYGLDWEGDGTPNEYPTWESILEKLL